MAHDIMAGMTLVSASPFHSISKNEIFISSNPQDKEVYKIGSTKEGSKWVDVYALSKFALDKLMIAAGIEEVSSESHRNGDARQWEAKFTGKYMRPDGTEVALPGSKEIDLTIGGTRWTDEKQKHLDYLLIAEGPRVGFKKYNYKEDKKDNYAISVLAKLESANLERLKELRYIAEAKATRYVTQAAKFGLGLAETGARLRAVRSMMQIGTYTAKQLQEPFIIYSSRFDWEKLQELLGEESAQKLLMAHVAKEIDVDLATVVQIPESASEPKSNVIEVDLEIGAEWEFGTMLEGTALEIANAFNKLGRKAEVASKYLFGTDLYRGLSDAQGKMLAMYADDLTEAKKESSKDELKARAKEIKAFLVRCVEEQYLPATLEEMNESTD